VKADVFPAAIPPKLDIPSWVPDVIAQSVSARYAADAAWLYREALRESGYFGLDDFGFDRADKLPDEYLDALIRDDVALREGAVDLARDDLADTTGRYLPLACDPRMEGVWRELSKHGSSGGFLHPANGTDQDAAMLELFDTAVMCRKRPGTTMTQRQAELGRDRWLAKAGKLQDDARIIMVASSFDASHERFRKLVAAAQVYEDYANEVYATLSAMALERKHDGQGRWVALTIGNKFHALFGKPMYGLTRTVVSIILGREIKYSTVCKWLKTRV
jgi:hypothetical protein